jgi:hypothetical protein
MERTNEQIGSKKINHPRSLLGIDDGPTEVVSHPQTDDEFIKLVLFFLSALSVPSFSYTSAITLFVCPNVHSSLQSHLLILFSPIPHPFCLVHVKTNILGPSHHLYTFTAFSPSIHSFVVLYQFIETIVCMFLSALASGGVWSTIYISWELITVRLKGIVFTS